RCNQRLTSRVINHLRVNVRQTTEHIQTWAFSRPHDTAARAVMPAIAQFTLVFAFNISHVCLLLRLSSFTGLAADHFIRITNTLALVRLRRTQLANISGNLTDDLLVDTINIQAATAFL